MTRKEVYAQIEEMFGLVPKFFQIIPDKSLELEWELFKRIQMDEGAVPNKYRELIGLGIAAVTKCKYCVAFHQVAARLFGATDAEIEDALHFAKSVAGWSTWLNGYAFDFEEFKEELDEIASYIQKMVAKVA